MGRMIYRMCLVLVLIAAVTGGVYYYMTVYEKEAVPKKGTFVKTEQAGQKAGLEKISEAVQETAHAAGRVAETAAWKAGSMAQTAMDDAKEAFLYVGARTKVAAGQAGTGIKEAAMHATDAVREAAMHAERM